MAARSVSLAQLTAALVAARKALASTQSLLLALPPQKPHKQALFYLIH